MTGWMCAPIFYGSFFTVGFFTVSIFSGGRALINSVYLVIIRAHEKTVLLAVTNDHHNQET